jgi:hypothetical protein
MDSLDPDVLARVAIERPRLMATRSAIARTQALLQQNAVAQQWHAAVAEQADLMLSLPPLTPLWVPDPREISAAPLPLVRPQLSDGQAAALDIARLFCLRIQTLGITWFLTDDPRYRDRAKLELLAVCAFPDWAGDEFLVTAETAFGAAIGYDWLYEALTEGEREQIARAIVDKAIQPGLDQFALSPPPPQRWMYRATNWNLVCNGALMIAALSVLESDPRAARLFALCRTSVFAGFNGYGPDGGWVEGPGYWHYATQYAIYLLDSLATALGTDFRLDRSPGLSRTGLFRLHAAGPSGKLFNFADSEEKHSGGYWLFWLARRYNHPVDAWIEQHRGKVHPMDLLWFDENARNPIRLPLAQWFRNADVMMLRGGWNPTDTYLGVKGGTNDSCRHAHYDLGSFVLDIDGVRWAKDLGPDNYGLPGYFTPEMKSRYYRTSTIGHNTIVIDGQCQPPTAHASIIRASFREKISLVVMDLSEAYPSAARALRGFALIDCRHVLVVDEIVPDEPLSSVDWQMHTEANVELGEPVVALTQPAASDGAAALRCYLRLIEPSSGNLSLVPATPSKESPGQNRNAGVAKLVLHLERVDRPVRLAILLSPDMTACATPELPAALRRPLMEWALSAGRTRRR